MESELDGQLQAAWASVQMPRDSNVKVLVGQVNVRLNVFKALATVYYGAKIYFETKKAAFTPWTVLKMGKDVWEAVGAALEALVQQLTKPVYTLAVVLSAKETPVTADELRRSLEEFIGADVEKKSDIPWHLHITHQCLEETRQMLTLPRGFADLLKGLERAELAKEVDGKWVYVPRHWSWRGEMEKQAV